MSPDPDAELARYGARLADAVQAVLAAWVKRSVEGILTAWHLGEPLDPAVEAAAVAAGDQAVADVVPALRALLAQDLDEQRTNPLTLVRRAVRYPTEVLANAGVPAVVRDEFAERTFPEDRYGLSPATFADLDPSVHEPGLEWGAAKAYAHLRRRAAGPGLPQR